MATQNVTIIGLGLIGTSIGLGLRRWSQERSKDGQAALELTGFDSNLERQNIAKKMGAVDKTEWDLSKAIRSADLVVLAVPVRSTSEVLTDIAPYLNSGTVITDVGSTKTDVMQWASEILPVTVSFVGGHPMAGKEAGQQGADPDLFQGAAWCVTPSVTATDEAVRTVIGMVSALGGEPFFIDPSEHDAFVGGISHLPAVVSATMVTAVASDPSWKEMKGLAAGGFRDMSRLAGGDPTMHRDIVLTNKDSVLRWIDSMQMQLAEFKTMLEQPEVQSAESLWTYFDNAQTARAEWVTRLPRSAEQSVSSSIPVREGLQEQMGRMLFGNLRRRKPAMTPKPVEPSPAPAAANGSDQGTIDQ